MSQLREALRVAGIVSPNERLREIAIEAMSRNATSNDAAIEAVLRVVRDDLALTWALFTPYDSIAVKKLFADVRFELREDTKVREASRAFGEFRGNAAPAAPQGGGQLRTENHVHRAPSQPASRPITPDQRAAKATTAEVIRMSLLDTFQIEGRPIGDWQAGEARSWARNTGRHVRWVEMLTANIPPVDLIRRWVTPGDAQTLWNRTAREGDE